MQLSSKLSVFLYILSPTMCQCVFVSAQCYASVGICYGPMSLCLFVTCWYCIKTAGTLNVYWWLTLCLRKLQLQGFTTLTYSTNCILPLKRSIEESWPKYPYFCTTMHLLTGHMLDKLLYLNPDLMKCITHHILLSWHWVITICFQIWSNTSMDKGGGYFEK